MAMAVQDADKGYLLYSMLRCSVHGFWLALSVGSWSRPSEQMGVQDCGSLATA